MNDLGGFRVVILFIFGVLVLLRTNVRGDSENISGCLRGSGCSQCPKTRYTVDPDGQMLCCPGCSAAVLYHGKHPSDWCICTAGSFPSGSQSKTPKFPGGISSRSPIITGGGGSSSNAFPGYGYGYGHGGTVNTKLNDALYILNHGNIRSSQISEAVHQAITLMADTIEELNLRITCLENIVLHSGAGPQGQSIDRLGSAAASPTSTEATTGTVPPSPTGGRPCNSKNFTRIGNSCYYVSAWKDHRAVWEKASHICEDMGAKLAEPLNPSDFDELSQYLSLAKTTTGYSYWLGGLYLGSPWLWSYAGTPVNLSSAYWIGVDPDGKSVSPGDPAPGRCLAFSYLSSSKNYYYAADQCGFEKFYVCELLEKSHRRL
ncbi:uncharacterized protein [Macrobrachium rosenbergii]|uniref:uncharacterized protein isoform X1 n=1 Tax=Macrobrachium rosenbergii TaxID=79674 RepID=UPI0034D4B6E0